MPPPLTRTVFQTSRVLEFFTERELTMQIGFPRAHWPLALLKELLDNALDSCETIGVPPVLTVTLNHDTLSVQDNGPGLPRATLERSLDFLVRVSDKAYYASPTRGQLGNALKCVWAAPYVVDGSHGRVDVETGGVAYQIDVTLDPIAQEPHLTLTTHEASAERFGKNGTCITLHWPGIARYLSPEGITDFYKAEELLQRYALFNPHATLTYHGPRMSAVTWPRTCDTLTKWVPSQPTSPHWYTVERLQALLAAYLAEDRRQGRRRTVREVVAEFDGLSGSVAQRQVVEGAQLHRATLEDLVRGECLDTPVVTRLLKAMQDRARPVLPAVLGLIGEAHLRKQLIEHYGVEATSITYKKYADSADGIPYILELALGWYPDCRASAGRTTLLGYNFTPALRMPFQELPNLYVAAAVDYRDPVVLAVHLTSPRLDATDRGKTAVVLPPAVTEALAEGMQAVSKRWQKLKKALEREGHAALRAEQERRRHDRQLSVKEAAWQVMEAAYRHASDHGRLPANARQIMYAARPLISALTTRPFDAVYFTQHLLPDFLEDHQDLTAEWDVVFDARGHFLEPHTGTQLGLGTLEVRGYIRAWQRELSPTLAQLTVPHAIRTAGPWHRYQYALFIEKEGFFPLLERAQIAKKYDLALMSTKGQTVTAARHLVERLSRAGATILVLHDFDKSGLEILDKFQADTRRYRYVETPTVIDLGLRLADAHAMGLQSEPVVYASKVDPAESLRRCGAREDECAFLVRQRADRDKWEGQRIELNAMTSQGFLTWLEDKLRAAGVHKLIPETQALTTSYRHLWRTAVLQQALDTARDTLPAADTIVVPDTLAEALRDALTDDPRLAWDQALWNIVCAAQGEA